MRMVEKVLILAGYYKPGVKGGGPIQSIQNLVNNLSNHYDFHVLANDRDLGDTKPYERIELNKWINTGFEKVYYTDYKFLSLNKLKRIINSQAFDVIYINSFFDPKLSIYPMILKKMKIIDNVKIVIAPRGNFSTGALELKKWKKLLYIKISRMFNLYQEVIWHATTPMEKKDIEMILGKKIDVAVANNLTANYSNLTYDKKIEKLEGELKLVYVARIHPMKNLFQILELLQKTEGNIEFNIYGPIEDKQYWEKCQNVINKIKDGININYFGPIINEKVNGVYRENHVAILLTFGENFGHSIAEALIGGCPVIISDQTPWKNLQDYNVGYDLPLNNEEKLIDVINNYVKMNHQDYERSSMSAFEYAKSNSNTDESINTYLKMFNGVS